MEDNPSDTKPSLDGDAFTTAATATTATTAMAATTPASAESVTPSAPDQQASPALSSASSSARRPYVPQFSAATQMILSRINNNKPGSLSAALSSASSVARSIEKSTFEDAKRRLVMNMNTSLTMPIPKLPSRKAPASGPRALTMPMGDAFQLRTPAPISTPTSAKSSVVKLAAAKPTPTKPKGKAARGTKRKRGKDDEDSSSSLSELSDSDIDAAAASTKAATKTKSGRQVQKPMQYNPNDAPGSQKRKNYGKRTAEQALCKVCTRGLSPLTNQVVFCDGCNNCWHQLCHDPYIDDEFVADENRSWFCSGCTSKREKALAKKKTLVEHKGVSWASKTPAQKRSYLTDLPHAQLVNIIMYSTELHPDLPIFPGQEPVTTTKRGAPGLLGGSSTYSPSPQPNIRAIGPTNFNQTVSSSLTKMSDQSSVKSNGKRKGSAEAQRSQAERESSADSVPQAWPKVGQGILTGLDMDEDDLRDKNDFEAFSVTTYDNKGRKLVENGMPV